jgi:hypothetical protein
MIGMIGVIGVIGKDVSCTVRAQTRFYRRYRGLYRRYRGGEYFFCRKVCHNDGLRKIQPILM